MYVKINDPQTPLTRMKCLRARTFALNYPGQMNKFEVCKEVSLFKEIINNAAQCIEAIKTERTKTARH